MSRLILVRHGEAIYRRPDADELSQIGRDQAQRLGKYWAEREMRFDQVFVGPRTRHRQTHDLTAEEFVKRGLRWPDAVETPALDEYAGFAVVRRARPEIVAGEMVPEDYRMIYREVTRQWVLGEIEFPELENWQHFRERVRRFAEPLAEVIGNGVRVVGFTSAGAVAASTAYALELTDLKTLELSFAVSNTGCVEFRAEDGNLALQSFNTTHHLS